MQATSKGISLIIAAYSFYAFSDVFKKGLVGPVGVFELQFFTALIAVILLLPAARWLGGRKRTFQTKHPWMHAIRSICAAVTGILVVFSLQYLSLAHFYTIVFMAPFVIMIFSVIFLKESVTWRHWALTILAFLGVLVVIRPGIEPLTPGHYAVMIGLFTFAGSQLPLKYMRDGETNLSFALYPLIAAIFINGIAVVQDVNIPSLPHLGLLALAALCISSAHIFVARAFKVIAASLAAPFQYIQLVWGILFGFLLFDDQPDFWTWVGSLMIVAAGIGLFLDKRFSRRQS